MSRKLNSEDASYGRSPAATDFAPFPQLDFVRSVAVLLVFFGHLIYIFDNDHFVSSAAHFGVLLFFVHTSLVLFMSLERIARKDNRLFARFYMQRVFRIYPLSIVAVLSMWHFRLLSAPWVAAYQGVSTRTLLANLALVQNLTNDPSILSPLWSLPFEVQMYALLPLLFVLYSRKHLSGTWIFAAGLAAAVGAREIETLLTEAYPINLRAAALVHYAPCFCAGIVAYDLMRRPATLRFPSFVRFLGAVIVAYVGLASTLNYFHLDRADALTDATGCIITALVIGRCGEPTSVLIRRGSAVIAKYSYGIYLAHLPLMSLCFHRNHSVAHCSAFVVAMLTIPPFAYHSLEEPMIRLGKRIANIVCPFRPEDSPLQTIALPEQISAECVAP